MTSTTKVLLGAAAGIAVGLLVAPKKGQDLRNDITDTAEKWRNQLGKLVGRANGRLEDFKTYLDEHIDELSDDVKRKILDIIDTAEKTTKNVKRHVNNGVFS